jgi:hypothetical protein
MTMRLWVACLALFLSSCWVGTDFYRGVRPRAVLLPGVYTVQTQGEDQPSQLRIEALRNGLMRATQLNVPDNEQPDQWTFATFPLPGSSDKFVVRVTAGNEPAPANRIVYAVLQRARDGSFSLAAPLCEDTRALATRYRAGYLPEIAELPFCVFRSRGDVERALAALPATAFERRLVPVRSAR